MTVLFSGKVPELPFGDPMVYYTGSRRTKAHDVR
jgi:hypothetical protein